MTSRKKAAVCIFLAASNLCFLVFLRQRRATAPVGLRKWRALAERTADERASIVATAFSLADFDIKPLATEDDSVTIPLPNHWREQMLVKTGYLCSLPSTDHLDDNPGTFTAAASITSIAVSAYDTVATQNTNRTLVKERLIHRDVFMTKNSIPVPIFELVTVGRYYVRQHDNTLVQTQRAFQVNGTPSINYSAIVPHWLLPRRSLAIGEKWEQTGVHPIGVPTSVPRPTVNRMLNRLVMFEGRRAAEMSSAGTYYDFVPGPDGTHDKRAEISLVYIDLETGEPLWYEAKSEGDRDFSSLVRGCNQIFTKHLLRVPRQ